MTWKSERLRPHVGRITFDSSPAAFYLMADLHWDNAHCRRDLLKKHLDAAKASNAPVIFAGDTFCLMQGKYDPRSSQKQLRDEHRRDDYLSGIIETACEWFEPYKDIIAFVGLGNHEGSVIDRHGTDVLKEWAIQLHANKSRKMASECVMPYWFFVQLRVRFGNGKTDYLTRSLFCHHGYGGGGEITRGLIDNSRTGRQYDADLYLSGHIHRVNYDQNVMTSITTRGEVVTRKQHFLRAGTYKDETECYYHVSRGRAARPLGGWLVEPIIGTVRDERVIDFRCTPLGEL